MFLRGSTTLSIWAATLIACANALPSNTTRQACKKLETAVPDRVSYPLTLDYASEVNSYWSTALREAKPACLVLPTSPEDVAAAVRVLNDFSDVEFAVKSGGHDPNPRHASVKDGVLISMADLKGTTYDEDKGLAYVKPGGQWNDVVGALDAQGVTVLGGRLGVVGVGGYLLQGGISFLSSQHGLAADSIVGWETVTADGSIVNVDAEKDPELAVAMRGSGSQFGIVTQFTIKAYPIGKVWGGSRIYDDSKADELYAALHDFVPDPEDPKEAIISSNIIIVGGAKTHIMFYFYDGPEPPKTGAFAKFLEIDSILDTCKEQSYSDLLKANGASADLLQARINFRTYTIPYLKEKPGVYSEILDKFDEILKKFVSNPLHLTTQCSIDFQPFPSLMGSHSAKAGGNAMGISGSDPDRILLEIQCSWASETDDETMYGLTEKLTDWLDEKVPEWTGEKEGSIYLPLFMNDASGDQNVTGTYKDYAKFKAMQEKIDPEGFFKTRGGGFTY